MPVVINSTVRDSAKFIFVVAHSGAKLYFLDCTVQVYISLAPKMTVTLTALNTVVE